MTTEPDYDARLSWLEASAGNYGTPPGEPRFYVCSECSAIGITTEERRRCSVCGRAGDCLVMDGLQAHHVHRMVCERLRARSTGPTLAVVPEDALLRADDEAAWAPAG